MKDGDDANDDMEMRDNDVRDNKAPEASDMSGPGSSMDPYTPYMRKSFSPDQSPFSYPPYQTTAFPYDYVTPPPLKRPRIHEDDNLSDVGSSCFFDSGVTVSQYLHVLLMCTCALVRSEL